MAKDTEKIILEVARKQFVTNGFAGARMQSIANEAGINKAMLHYYFRSKEKLYNEIIKQTLDNIIPRFAKAIDSEGGFWEKLETIIETYIDTLSEHPEIPIFVMSELSRQREDFIEEVKKRTAYFPAVKLFMKDMMEEMQQGNIRMMAPQHLFLNIIGMTVFPFIAKPIFCTVFQVPEQQFSTLMQERKKVIFNFVKDALIISK